MSDPPHIALEFTSLGARYGDEENVSVVMCTVKPFVDWDKSHILQYRLYSLEISTKNSTSPLPLFSVVLLL